MVVGVVEPSVAVEVAGLDLLGARTAAELSVLELREGQVLSTDYKLEGEYEALVLNDRRRDAVSFASVRHGSFEAEGHVVPALGGSIEGLEEMVGRHVTYRSPSGRVTNVAVTGISLIEVFDRTEVQVSMIEED